jgi:hypothetical protein
VCEIVRDQVELIVSAKKFAGQVMESTACGMQQLLYRRGGVRAPARWLGRVHGGRGWTGWRGWDTDCFGGEAGLETIAELDDYDGDVIVEKKLVFWRFDFEMRK